LDLRAAVSAAVVAGAATLGWILALRLMDGMDMGPGTELGSFGSFLAVWASMMAAMMLPAALPTVLSVDRSARSRGGRAPLAGSLLFVGSYLALWVLVGVAAYLLDQAVRAVGPGFLTWDAGGRYVAGGAVVAAGLYQLTPLKRAFLRRCREAGEQATASPVLAGLCYGRNCVGCSGGLILVLFAVGVMSVFWMVAVTVLIVLERTAPIGERFVAPIALLLLALGLWIAVAPASVPGLTVPM